MRFVPIFMLCLSLCVYSANTMIPISSKTSSICQRFYFIQRLRKATEFILNNDDLQAVVTCQSIDLSLFSHHHIAHRLALFTQAQSMHHIGELWRDYTSYRYVEDDLFNREFISLILTLYERLILEKDLLPSGMRTADSPLHLLDLYYDCLRNEQVDHKLVDDTPACEDVTVDAIALCFYIHKRLARSCALLEHMNLHVVPKIVAFSEDYLECFVSEEGLFCDQRIKRCLERIAAEKSFKPFFDLLYPILQYRHINNRRYMQEVVKLIFVMCKNLLVFQSVDNSVVATDTTDAILELYKNVGALSLEELLEAIDKATTKLIELQEAEQHSNPSWYETLLSWAPLGSMTGVVGSLLYWGLHS